MRQKPRERSCFEIPSKRKLETQFSPVQIWLEFIFLGFDRAPGRQDSVPIWRVSIETTRLWILNPAGSEADGVFFNYQNCASNGSGGVVRSALCSRCLGGVDASATDYNTGP